MYNSQSREDVIIDCQFEFFFFLYIIIRCEGTYFNSSSQQLVEIVDLCGKIAKYIRKKKKNDSCLSGFDSCLNYLYRTSRLSQIIVVVMLGILILLISICDKSRTSGLLPQQSKITKHKTIMTILFIFFLINNNK